ncbi:pseudouridine synthase [Kaistia terrae]|uniref:Pseudouridine synthase n=1 Tax=Kaistia terrae TaxID=537017 RepID=A0ABW0PVS6_9HYPH|nr:pseudouridine synthase [Kaistia terrae]MCX5579524.1 pseudouridine synthase [Kaistia terrae]
MKPPQKRTKDSPAQDDAQDDRIAKVLARAGLCSRRDAERLIEEGRVAINGTVLTSPAVNVGPHDRVTVDDEPLPTKERTRLWLYHKPKGLVTTAHDPEGRPTVFDALPDTLPRVIAIGRLDINTEGLLLLTNDGGLARVLELPSTGWMRRYRVRAWGDILQPDLDKLKDGVSIEGVMYGAIEGILDRVQGSNIWATIGLREGKNREVKKVLSSIGLDVNRLIRISYGPFQLGDLPEGEAVEIKGRVLRDQLGDKLALEAGADFDAPLREEAEAARRKTRKAGGRIISRGPIKPLAQVRPTGERPVRIDKRQSEESETGMRREGRSGAPPRGGRSSEGRPARGERSAEGRAPRGERPTEGRAPRSERPFEGRAPRGERPEGRAPRAERSFEGRPPRGDRSEARAPRGERTFDGSPPRGERPEGRAPREERSFEGRAPRGERPAEGRRGRGERPTETEAPSRASHRGAARGRGRGEGVAEGGDKREFQDGRRFEGGLRPARPVGRNLDGEKPARGPRGGIVKSGGRPGSGGKSGAGKGGPKMGRSFDKRPVTGRNPDGDKHRGGRPGGKPSGGGGKPSGSGGAGGRSGGAGRADRRR